ncbi:hypothetical protein KDA_29390 [Dictyobacter alpinus]|uniref:3-keto-disaccharide hydrolase domain-containing protein n=1 Tax=Dictyobacter alpinus TaxID=2014873 RepID=A0A402B7X8_9CHLR|nr:hypothetical protein [Dictyobacter alpinus]GCE27455.1 hypothetical protein KDA_29390 [Dictyobacter alpinus]
MIANQTVISNWHIQEDALVQTEISAGEHRILNSSALAHFEFSTTMRIRQGSEETMRAFGILTQYTEHDELQVCLLKQHEHWGLAVETIGISPVVNHVLSLPASFDPTSWHTLLLVQQPEQTTIYLDGTEMLSINDPARPAQSGLLTINTAAEFTTIRQQNINV